MLARSTGAGGSFSSGRDAQLGPTSAPIGRLSLDSRCPLEVGGVLRPVGASIGLAQYVYCGPFTVTFGQVGVSLGHDKLIAMLGRILSSNHVGPPIGDAARRMLAESFRLLRPGGWIRIATPNLARFVRFYTDPDTPAHQRYFNRIVGSFALAADRPPRTTVVNSLFFLHGHRFIFDEAALAPLFRQVGFTDLRRCEPDVSEVPDLRGIHQHHYAIGVEANALETLVLEARRP